MYLKNIEMDKDTDIKYTLKIDNYESSITIWEGVLTSSKEPRIFMVATIPWISNHGTAISKMFEANTSIEEIKYQTEKALIEEFSRFKDGTTSFNSKFFNENPNGNSESKTTHEA